ncbi:MAG: fumarylacetoacetate hydrolase family protein, partial [Proteobacteria bacterium]|nr:fumarylacetoacetate hydrolase family protein [Pseudomonadota bacterium]
MKLCTFTHQGIDGFGVVKDGEVADLTEALSGEGITDLRGLIGAGLLGSCEKMAQSITARYALKDIEFKPVIPNPGKIICLGINYHSHKVETGNPDNEYPMLFTRYPESQIGHLEPLLRPRESDKLDYEGELAVIIGKSGRRIKQEDALSHVAGYSCYNDGSVRDWQHHTTQFLAGKTFVGTGPFGPWMVTTDEIPDPSQLHLETRLNGQT